MRELLYDMMVIIKQRQHWSDMNAMSGEHHELLPDRHLQPGTEVVQWQKEFL